MLAAGGHLQNGRSGAKGVVEGQTVEGFDVALDQSDAFADVVVVGDVPVDEPGVLEVKPVHPHAVGLLSVHVEVDAVHAVVIGGVVHRVVGIHQEGHAAEAFTRACSRPFSKTMRRGSERVSSESDPSRFMR